MSKGLEQCDKCDYFISVEEAYKLGKKDSIDEVIDKIEKQRLIYYFTLANSKNESDNFAWEVLSRTLDKIEEQLKER